MSARPHRRIAAALLVLCAIGCGPPEPAQRPVQVTVLPFAGPAADAQGGIVVAYHPWSGSIDRVTAKGATGSTFVDGAKVSCTNMPCEYRSEGRYLTISAPPAGVDHVEVLVEKDGFEPLRFQVPFTIHDSHPSVLVVLTPAGAAVAK